MLQLEEGVHAGVRNAMLEKRAVKVIRDATLKRRGVSASKQAAPTRRRAKVGGVCCTDKESSTGFS